MPTRNRELFYRIAEQVEKHPETYDQSVWGNSCGTAHCVAGWAAHLSGCKANPQPESDWHRWAYCIPPGCGETHSTSDVASELLGLTVKEAEDLFDQDWVPPRKMSVPEALRAIGDGAEIELLPPEDDEDDEDDEE